MERFSLLEERGTGDKLEAKDAGNTSGKSPESLCAYRGLSGEHAWVVICHCPVLRELREVYCFNAPTAIADPYLSRLFSARRDWGLR